MPTLLVVHHSPTPATRALTDAVIAGAGDDLIAEAAGGSLRVVARPALEANADDVLAADGYLLLTPANFGYMSGALKHFFDTIFLQAGGALAADGKAEGAAPSSGRKPFGLLVHGRYDTTGAVRSVQAIVGALGWRQAAGVVQILGDVDDEARESAYELGGTLAAVLVA